MDNNQQEKMKQMDPEELEMLKKLKANNWESKQGVYPSWSTETNGENAQGESGSEISGGVKSAEKEKTATPQAEFSKNAEEEFLKAIGVTKKPAQKSATKENNKKKPGKKLVNVVDDSKAAEEAALKEFLSETSKLNANPLFLVFSLRIRTTLLSNLRENFPQWRKCLHRMPNLSMIILKITILVINMMPL